MTDNGPSARCRSRQRSSCPNPTIGRELFRNNDAPPSSIHQNRTGPSGALTPVRSFPGIFLIRRSVKKIAIFDGYFSSASGRWNASSAARRQQEATDPIATSGSRTSKPTTRQAGSPASWAAKIGQKTRIKVQQTVNSLGECLCVCCFWL